MLEVAAFTGGAAVPSARFRVRQYIGALGMMGIRLEEMPSRCGKYPSGPRFIRPLWLAATLCEQAVNFSKLRKYDVVLLQREVVSKLVTFERWMNGPVVLDVDDAIFLFRGGHVARSLAECAAIVVCGNAYLAEWFAKWNANVRVIPTAIDTDRYRPIQKASSDEEVVIGWIGTSSNLSELAAIESSLGTVLARFPNAKLRVVCDRPPRLPVLNAEQVEYVSWEENTEVRCIQSMDVGIMPLRDSAWARGKCSFKLLQYMACGLPAVVSAVGMNSEVAAIRGCAHAVRGKNEWVEALTSLVASVDCRRRMGGVAREVAESVFSVHVLAPRFADAIWQARGNHDAGDVRVTDRARAVVGSTHLPNP